MSALSVSSQEYQMFEYLKDYRCAEIRLKPNYVKIPCHRIPVTDEGAHLMNRILEDIYKVPDFTVIRRTKSGGISLTDLILPCYDVRNLKTMVEITLCAVEGMWRFQFASNPLTDKEQGISGHKAFLKFQELCKKHNINIQNYRINNGIEYKKDIKYIRALDNPAFADLTFENCHHIDFNSSFMANLCEKYPEFKPVGEILYNGRKAHPINKGIMTNTIGYFHSKYHQYSWAHLANAAIVGNNNKIAEIRQKLIESGRLPLLINTDGIWYAGDIYHDENEGANLGQWKTDHKNCTLRAASPNKYQFIEDGKVHTVISGTTILDRVKPRDKWEWGDIYLDGAEVITYKFINGFITNNKGDIL